MEDGDNNEFSQTGGDIPCNIICCEEIEVESIDGIVECLCDGSAILTLENILNMDTISFIEAYWHNDTGEYLQNGDTIPANSILEIPFVYNGFDCYEVIYENNFLNIIFDNNKQIKIASLNENIDLKIALRDEHLDLMDEHLTNGGRSIPKLIMRDKETKEVLNTFGPRPNEATKLVEDYKNTYGVLTPEFKKDLQLWYTKDKGQNAVNDLVSLLA